MFKFLRKYNKWILAVGGTLLLITFLIPFAFTQLGDLAARTGATWATVGAPERRKVTSGELAQLQAELRLLDTIQQVQGPLIPGLEPVSDPAHWYLLVREAEAAGLVGGAGARANAVDLAQVAAITGQSPAFIGQTFAKVDGVRRLLNLYLDGNKLSDRRLRLEARRHFHRVDADLVVIEASTPPTPRTFSERELREQLEQYADVAPGEGERGFGYRLPDRARIEWLAIPADTVRDTIAASDAMGPVALRKHWYDNPRFGPVEPTAAVPDDVRSDLLETLTERRLQEIAKFANDKLRIHRRGIPQRDGYYDLPEAWSDLDFPTLALDVQQEFDLPLPEYHSTGERWLEETDLAGLEGIGTATTDKFGRVAVALPALVMAAREFGGVQTTPMQVGVSGPPLSDTNGSVYLFRVLDADPARPPRDLDEVRDQVVADLERLAHYEELVRDVETLRQSAIDKGLLAVALDHATQVRRAGSLAITDLGSLLTLSGPDGGSPQPTALPVIGRDLPTVTAIVDRAMAFSPETPMSEVPEAERTFVLPVESKLAVIVVRITRQSPLTTEQFANYVGWGIVQRPLQAEFLDDDAELATVFGYDALAARYDFKLATGDATTEPEAG